MSGFRTFWCFQTLLAAKNSTLRSLLGDPRCLCLPGLLASGLLSLLDISSAGAAAAKTGLDQPGENGGGCRNPHECEHLGTQACTNVELRDRGECVLHNDEHHSCNDGSDGDEQGGQEGEYAGEQGEPAGEDGERVQKHHNEGQAGTCKEEAKHPVRNGFNQAEDIGEIGR